MPMNQPDFQKITPLLLISPNGMLGRAWRELLDAHGLDYETAARPDFDLNQPETIEAHLVDGVRTVINCSAWTDVDGAETHEADAMLVNGEAVGQLARRCQAINATLVHYSTDYVFNGRAETPYRTDQPRDPLNAYGRTKARGELLIEQSGCEHLIIRTSWLYAPWGSNFVRTMARLTAEKPTLRVVDDQRGRPTSCEHLATTSLALLQNGGRGVYHITDGGECTWCEFTQEINRQLGHSCDVQPCTTDEFPRPAKRPAYSVLDLSEAEHLVGPMPEWKVNLRSVLDRMAGSTE
ncbi:dTDP-4-dehydrorhamnose reductase [Phycisphaerales bacterium AB-hyl4]|uniref:dTDP-4-dehydrorhamnose reductase n=1 Tax=Natronomicrosphaera hydrolytica TaxID=3242702 RepID=A0ABV4U5D7_9BACT